MAKLEFSSLAAEELYWHDRAAEYKGDRRGCDMTVRPNFIYDESTQINLYCDAAKAILGLRARSFRDAVHVMKFIVGIVELPEPIEDWPDGGARELACV